MALPTLTDVRFIDRKPDNNQDNYEIMLDFSNDRHHLLVIEENMTGKQIGDALVQFGLAVQYDENLTTLVQE